MASGKWIAAIAGVVLLVTAGADETSDLAQELANPIAAIISVPFQWNRDDNIGATDSGRRTMLNFQPVIPFGLHNGANIITRTIVPYIGQENGVPVTSQSGFGDILQNAWYSPAPQGDLIWGVGPIMRIPTGSDVSSDTWAAGITGIGVVQTGNWTYGALANHIWDIESNPDTPTNSTLLQPFVAYTTETALMVSLQSESTYDWEAEQWSIPVNLAVSKLAILGQVPVNFQGGLGDWAEAPSTGPEGI
ncbi:transporter [Ruegeria sp. 2205SS24-7]|uniref:transporter n=1 Tax=Ruegeria discodermiae TaxID=3064389 RepID=UPI002741A48E|nr:transporter [Ruegeria sp. 2205SS24-7]MDP5215892.1 transporter [Ruegeria sp. 2205SS24-7]